MIQMSSPFLRALIYNYSYHCPPESLSRLPVFSIGDLLPRVPSPDFSCLSNSTLSLLEPDSLVTHRCCVPLRTVIACGYASSLRTCTSRLGTHRPCVQLRTLVAYMHLTTRFGRHTRRRPISNNRPTPWLKYLYPR